MDREQLIARVHQMADRVDAWLGRMNAADRAEWRKAENLADVGVLTARWLAGDLGAQPGYLASVDVDEDDVPGLTDTLISLNRTGVVTTGSQAGYDGPGYDGAHWTQRAAVAALADPDTANALRQRLAEHDGLVVADRQGGWLAGLRAPVAPVTCRDGNTVTDFGLRESVAEYTAACPAAAFDLAAAAQLVIYDAVWGRNDRLWPALHAAADQHSDTDGM